MIILCVSTGVMAISPKSKMEWIEEGVDYQMEISS